EKALTVVHGNPCLHPSAAGRGGLDDHRPDSHAAHHDVAHWKRVPGWRSGWPELRHQCALLADPFRQRLILGRVNAIDPSPHYGDGPPADLECCRMSSGIDPHG